MRFIFNRSKSRERNGRSAECDYLTGLANRGGLYEYYKKLDKQTVLHTLFIDIDNFKRVNDIYGHSMGDELLVQISSLIKSHVKGFISRIGGDEYIAILDGSMSQKEVILIAEDLITDFNKMNYRKDILAIVSLSIGIVLEQKAEIPLDDLLSKCDAAMYQAKYDGKNQYAVYKEFDKTVEVNRNIELEMEDALKNGEFKVYLQPKVNMVSSKIYGAEALSRWVHPVDGIRPPIVYIPLFEKNGFISKLDMYVYEEVCRIKAGWVGEKYEHIPISVNMSRLHLYNERFPDMLTDIADKYGVNKNELEIEITESVFIKDSQELISIVNILRSRGFLVSIDDFGSGFSALNLLKDIPVDTIKIDKEFLRLSSDSTKGKKVIRNVIAMCKDLKLDIVTEGIETKEQIDFITSCGCQIAQGYYYSKPLPLDEFVDFANKYLINTLNSYTFRMDGSLKSEDESMDAQIIGDGLTYQNGIFKDSESMYFPGGDKEKNLVSIPCQSIVNDSFTVSLWIKPERNQEWTSAIYIKFESGFCSIVPSNVDKKADLRVRDSREVDGWYDITSEELPESRWSHYVVSYDSKWEKLQAYVNGKKVGVLERVPANRYVKRILLGGDMFQQSFKGNICELQIYNEAKEDDFVSKLYNSYVEDKNFIG